MKRFFSYMFFCSLFLLFSCTGENGGNEENQSLRRERKRDFRGNLELEGRRSSEIQRLKRADQIIDSVLRKRYDGGFYYEAYEGAECSEDEDCMDICDSRKIPSQSRRKCYSSPKALIENIEDGFRTLISISEVEAVNIKPALLAGMLDLNVNLVADLVEDKMSEGDLKSFLAWVALNEDIAKVFLAEDRRAKVMEEAFKALGDLQPSARKDEETGLSTGLIRDEDSFFSLSSEENNEAAFQIAYKVLESICSSRDCKMNVLCARELKTHSRSRIFGFDSSRLLYCKTSATQGRRARREGICYIHGAMVWSYLTELIEDEEIRDRDFRGVEKEITVEACNEYCGDEEDEKCKRIQ